MLSKWIIPIKGYENFVIGPNKQIYRLPYNGPKRSYGLRKLKRNPDTRKWTINGRTWTGDQINEVVVLDPDPIPLFNTDDLPF